jgi:hypothetical protein
MATPELEDEHGDVPNSPHPVLELALRRKMPSGSPLRVYAYPGARLTTCVRDVSEKA